MQWLNNLVQESDKSTFKSQYSAQCHIHSKYPTIISDSIIIYYSMETHLDWIDCL